MEEAQLLELEGQPNGQGRRIAIVVARFNEPVTTKLRDGALAALREAGVAEDDLVVAYVPGAVELPLAADRLASTGCYDAIVALGVVIRGETGHYDHVCHAAETGLSRVGLEQDLPVMFGVLTTDDGPQAFARAGGAKGNRGADAALAALRMIDLLEQLPGACPPERCEGAGCGDGACEDGPCEDGPCEDGEGAACAPEQSGGGE